MQSPTVHRIELRPNCSLSPRGAWLFFTSMLCVLLAIGLLFALQGYWPVLPFAGLELFALGAALGLSMRRGSWRETILIGEDFVQLEAAAGGRPVERVRFPRHWAGVRIRRSLHASFPSHLVIGCSGRWYEIGRFLTESDRQRLERRLQRLIGATNQTPVLEAARELRAGWADPPEPGDAPPSAGGSYE